MLDLTDIEDLPAPVESHRIGLNVVQASATPNTWQYGITDNGTYRFDEGTQADYVSDTALSIFITYLEFVDEKRSPVC